MSNTNEELPVFLYHGSRYKQPELMPGFNRSGKVVKWDETESNAFLYATSVKDTAIELGFASSVEKLLDVTKFRTEGKELIIETDTTVTFEKLCEIPVYLYKIRFEPKDGWKKNNNQNNGITTEFKTTQTIHAIEYCELVDIREWLKQYNVILKRSKFDKGIALESISSLSRFSW